MKYFLLLFLLSSFAGALPQLEDQVRLGAQNEKGVYQEIQVKPILVTYDYFSPDEESTFLVGAEYFKDEQNIGYSSLRPKWFKISNIYFQDQVLKTKNGNSTKYPQLDQNRDYGVITVLVGFANEQLAKNNLLIFEGHLTLKIRSERASFQVGSPFFQELQFNFSNPDFGSGKAINEAGNGLKDGGRTSSITLVLFNVSKEDVTLGQFRKIFGESISFEQP